MRKVKLCVALDGSLEIWTTKIENHCGFAVNPESGDPLYGTTFAKYRWEIEACFGSRSAFHVIPTEIFKDPSTKTIHAQHPEFWGREIIDQWEEE